MVKIKIEFELGLKELLSNIGIDADDVKEFMKEIEKKYPDIKSRLGKEKE